MALIVAAINEVRKVSQYDANTRGAVTVAQNASHISENVLMNAAESGISTISPR